MNLNVNMNNQFKKELIRWVQITTASWEQNESVNWKLIGSMIFRKLHIIQASAVAPLILSRNSTIYEYK